MKKLRSANTDRGGASCSFPDTASPTDTCICGHARAYHAPSFTPGAAKPCHVCHRPACDNFTKEPPTVHDERAAVRRQEKEKETAS